MLAALLLLSGAQVEWKPLFEGQLRDPNRTVTLSSSAPLKDSGTYGSFALEMDLKGKAGLLIRGHSFLGYRNGAVHGLFVRPNGQVVDLNRRTVPLSTIAPGSKAAKAYKAAGWNHLRVVAQGDHIQVWVNKVLASDIHDDLDRDGFFALQGEGSFRGARVKDLGVTGMKPPRTPQVWLRGPADLSQWAQERDPSKMEWEWVDGAMQGKPGTGDICTKYKFGSALIHVEFCVDDNGKTGQENGNSGVYLQRRYEVQVLNSVPRGPLIDECGAIYSIKPPDVAAALKAGEWQRYDIDFTAAVWKDGVKVANARMTVYHNGTLIHRDVELPRSTTAGKEEGPDPDGLRLQDHGHPIRYRSIWIVSKDK